MSTQNYCEDCLLTLEQIHSELLKSVELFDEFCKSRKLTYTLIGGTLLGAVRHRGFIPWDDDIDLGMPRNDYERLMNLGDELNTATGMTIGGYYGLEKENSPFIKIIRPDVMVYEETVARTTGLWIDVMPIDTLPADESELEAVYRRVAFWQKMMKFLYSTPESGSTVVKRLIKRIGSPLGKSEYLKQLCATRLNAIAKERPWGSTEYVGGVSWGLYGKGERFPAWGFDSLVMLEFEHLMLPAISCWEDYLTGVYGDYMQIPPLGERNAHSITAWRV